MRPLAKHRGAGERLHLVILRRAGAVSVYVVDFVGSGAGVGERIAHRADDGGAVGIAARAVIRIGAFAAARNNGENVGVS